MKLTKAQEELLREGVTVKNLTELRKAIQPFLPHNDALEETVLIETSAKDVKASQKEEKNIDRGGTIKATIPVLSKRRMLLQGLDMIDRQRELYSQQAPVDDAFFGGFKPVSVPGDGIRYAWVDMLIRRLLDGRRRPNNTIEWKLDDGVFVFDPKSGDLTREGDESSNS